MGKVRSSLSVSIDGFVGSVEEQAWDDHNRVHGWAYDLKAFNEQQGMAGGRDGADSDVLVERNSGIGAYVMGRTMFDFGDEPWGAEPPFHAPVFVLTSRLRDVDVREGGTSFTFVTDGIASAIKLAKEAAGDEDVFISGGASPVKQAFSAGLLDEFQMHVVPVLLGTGVRMFDDVDLRGVGLERTQAVVGDTVTHLTYRVAPEAAQ
jgi:dihydrofolate reductase